MSRQNWFIEKSNFIGGDDGSRFGGPGGGTQVDYDFILSDKNIMF